MREMHFQILVISLVAKTIKSYLLTKRYAIPSLKKYTVLIKIDTSSVVIFWL